MVDAGTGETMTVGAIRRSCRALRLRSASMAPSVASSSQRRVARPAHAGLAVSFWRRRARVLQRLRHGGVAGVGEGGEGLVDRPAGIEAAAHRVGCEPVHGGAAARLDIGHQSHELGERALEGSGRDGGQVGLEQDVLHRRGEVGVHRGRQLLRLVTGQQRPASAREGTPAGDAKPLGLLERRRHRVDAGRKPPGPAPAQRLDHSGCRRRPSLLGPLELTEDVTPQRPRGGHWTSGPRAFTVPELPAGEVPTRCAALVETSQARARTAQRLAPRRLLPLVIEGGGCPDGFEGPVIADEAGGQGKLGDEGRTALGHVQDCGEPPEVADGQTACPQHPWWSGSPLGGQLVEEHQEVADLLTGARVCGCGVAAVARGFRRSQDQLAVHPCPGAAGGRPLGEAELVGRDAEDESVGQQPACSLGDLARQCLPRQDRQRGPPGQAVQDGRAVAAPPRSGGRHSRGRPGAPGWTRAAPLRSAQARPRVARGPP